MKVLKGMLAIGSASLLLVGCEGFGTAGADYERLQTEVTGLRENYDTLNEGYSTLSENYASLNEEYAELGTNYNTLNENYTALRSEFDMFRQEWRTFYEDWSNNPDVEARQGGGEVGAAGEADDLTP